MRSAYPICAIMLVLASTAGLAAAQAVNNKGAIVSKAKQAAKQQQRGPVPTEELERLLQMSPQQRDQALANRPPLQQARIRARLGILDAMEPQQRERQLERARLLESLPPDRVPVVRQEVQRVNLMTFAQRRAWLHSDEFNQSFSPEEQQLIRERFPNAAR